MKSVLVAMTLVTIPALARDIEHADLDNRIAIDQSVPTLLMFPDSVQAVLSSSNLQLSSMSDGETSRLWKASPQCTKGCEDMNAEFVTNSGKHLFLRLKTQSGLKDHVLSFKDELPQGSLEATRQRIPPLAREAFLQVVRGRTSFAKNEEETPKSVKKFADNWVGYVTDHLMVFVGTPAKLTRKDVETLNDASLVLVGAYDDSVVVITRRMP
ncbi:MAG: hypothetical protein HYW48_02465 [Deltaproteobacteria bacterium]|nr:hypothetical protein [Deltaproteobacteria bacterium]